MDSTTTTTTNAGSPLPYPSSGCAATCEKDCVGDVGAAPLPSPAGGCVAARDNHNQTTHGATPLPTPAGGRAATCGEGCAGNIGAAPLRTPAAGGAPLPTPAGGAAPSWTPEWIERVKEAEAEAGRPICGAHLPDNTPCTRASDHPSGRCTHHGGHHLSGGPEGNRNAIIHGLYSRRLLICGDHCPRWFSCPYAGADLLEIPLKNRPNCVYEQLEYDTLTGTTSPDWEGTHGQEHGQARTHTGRRDDCGEPDEWDCSLPEDRSQRNSGCAATSDQGCPADDGAAPSGCPPGAAGGGGFGHFVALLHVMVGRAAACLSLYPLIKTKYDDNTLSTVPEYRPSAHLQAFLQLSREYRLAIRELTHIHSHGHGGAPRPSKPPKPPDPPRRPALADIMKPIIKKAEGVMELAIAAKEREDALAREKEREEARARGEQLPDPKPEPGASIAPADRDCPKHPRPREHTRDCSLPQEQSDTTQITCRDNRETLPKVTPKLPPKAGEGGPLSTPARGPGGAPPHKAQAFSESTVRRHCQPPLAAPVRVPHSPSPKVSRSSPEQIPRPSPEASTHLPGIPDGTPRPVEDPAATAGRPPPKSGNP